MWRKKTQKQQTRSTSGIGIPTKVEVVNSTTLRVMETTDNYATALRLQASLPGTFVRVASYSDGSHQTTEHLRAG